jgi:hypothetical protein
MEVPVELAQKIINYLTSKPYAEVHQLINELIQCKPKEKEDGQDYKSIGLS